MRILKSKLQFIILFLVALLVSCTYEPVDGTVEPVDGTVEPDPGSSSGVFKADFSGKPWTANETQAIVNSDYIAITAMKTDGSFFQITLSHGTVGTYNWSTATPTTPLVLAYSLGSGQVPYISESNSDAANDGYVNYVDTAELVISSINKTTNIITGTFKFTGVRFDNTFTKTEIKVFTKGQFSVSFTTNNTSPSTNSFFCKLDGSDFIPTNVDGIKASNSITINGRRGSVETIGLTLVAGITPGTYDLENLPLGTNNIGLYNKDMSGMNTFGANPGTVTITTHNTATKHIVGTFRFTGTSFFDVITHSVTNGSFDVYYQ
ncbi:DUF6252 family protein [Flavobacterium undicola]|uniref:DUF6252 family protein n=1 Tax=Flavobacterium undicola TaxID=1932779 RepID=UPI0013765870|nr:DUF6252 family protein [Flavobacterium undicola]MBA0885459.1 hypothetical protein [Flavobacterium undicola]